MTGTRLLHDVRGLLDAAHPTVAGTAAGEELVAARRRLDEPLRVAIAGRVKAGKSTLLNALIGEELAPTDASECTRIVTWYRDGITYRVVAEIDDGSEIPLRFRRDAGALDIDLGGLDEKRIRRLVVDWPSPALREMTLIDTPGLASITSGLSDRTRSFLLDERAAPADAVLYLMRHLHSDDLAFLEAFRDDVAAPTPVNAIGVLSRADEVAGGRLDAMESAARIAVRYRAEPKVRRLCQTVVPVAGLLGQAGVALTEDELRALRTIASAESGDAQALLLSADRLARGETPVPLTPLERSHLLEHFGMFGVRYAVTLLWEGTVDSAPALADALLTASGIGELRATLATQFASRRDVLKARSALLALEAVLHADGAAPAAELARELERVVSGAHDFAELRILNALHTGAVALRTDDDTADALRLLGADGSSAPRRLGLPEGTDEPEARQAAAAAAARWRRVAEHPLSSREVRDAAQVLVRSAERIAAGTPGA